MTVTKLPPILEFHTYPDLTQTNVLDTLFEPSPAIHATLLPVIRTAEYTTYPELIDACQIRLLSLAASTATGVIHPTLQSVLGSHPRLGEKKIESAQSVAEQAKLQQNSNPEQEAELARLNREYEETFPGLRYVVFVNGRGRPEIMEDMKARIAHSDLTKEVDAALQVSLRPPYVLMTEANHEPSRLCVTLQRTEPPSFNSCPHRYAKPKRKGKKKSDANKEGEKKKTGKEPKKLRSIKGQ